MTKILSIKPDPNISDKLITMTDEFGNIVVLKRNWIRYGNKLMKINVWTNYFTQLRNRRNTKVR